MRIAENIGWAVRVSVERARVKGPHLDWGLISYSWLYLLLKSVCSTLVLYPLAPRVRGVIHSLAGPSEYILYLGGEIFSARWSRYFITPLRARWWSLSLWFYGLLAVTFSALSIKRDKASSKLISDSGQNRISGIIQSTFYTHGLTQRTGGWRRSRTLISSLDAPHPHLFASNVYRAQADGKIDSFPRCTRQTDLFRRQQPLHSNLISTLTT